MKQIGQVAIARLRDPRFSLLWMTLAVILLIGLLSQTRFWQLVEMKGFDALTVITAPERSSLPITIVGIDETSFAELDRQWPWPRSVHAQLIEALTRSGAAVIAFDILFSEPSTPEEDDELFEAIQRHRNVVLAANLAFRETAVVRQWVRVDPLPLFQEASAYPGMAAVNLDPDTVVRRLPEYDDAMWRMTIAKFEDLHPGALGGVPDVEKGALIRYLGPNHTFPYVSYYQALDPETYLPPNFFKDHIVIVGRDVRASPEAGAAQSDTFATPFTMKTHFLTPGAEIHATAIENILTARSIRPAPNWASLIAIVVTVSLAGGLMRNWRPLTAGGVTLLILAAILGLDWYLFEFRNLWLPAASSATGVTLIYIAAGGLAFLTERRHRQEIKLAFSHYVAPQVMEEIIAHPERLALGGARREITVMFTDLAGFTSLAEKLSPEEVAHLLIEHFTEMTGIIQRRGGTVDKFIGDAIMAFWGAPIADPEQAVHACQAAQEMQEGMRRLCDALAARGLPEVVMRIGLHSGEAVVGNMGSASRFDYTAVGDNVNLASRLEGVNKLYGTRILLTDATAARAGAAVPLRRVDRVRVKGKSQPVEIFTLGEAGQPVVLNDAAIEAYRRRDWQESGRCWRDWLAAVPEDGVARVYLDRIDGFRNAPPAADWDGSVALEKM